MQVGARGTNDAGAVQRYHDAQARLEQMRAEETVVVGGRGPVTKGIAGAGVGALVLGGALLGLGAVTHAGAQAIGGRVLLGLGGAALAVAGLSAMKVQFTKDADRIEAQRDLVQHLYLQTDEGKAKLEADPYAFGVSVERYVRSSFRDFDHDGDGTIDLRPGQEMAVDERVERLFFQDPVHDADESVTVGLAPLTAADTDHDASVTPAELRAHLLHVLDGDGNGYLSQSERPGTLRLPETTYYDDYRDFADSAGGR